jgi:phage shock protein A
MSWIAGVAHGQALADMARRERARKQSIHSGEVYTNESLKATPGQAPKTIEPVKDQQAKPGTAKDNAKPTGPTDNKGRDEKYWRDAFDKARQALKRAEDKLRLLDLKMTDLSSQLLRESVYTREMELRVEIDKTTKDQLAARAEVAAAQQKIRDLEDELRRSGGLPGWAR